MAGQQLPDIEMHVMSRVLAVAHLSCFTTMDDRRSTAAHRLSSTVYRLARAKRVLGSLY
jgi:hypothetical protein